MRILITGVTGFAGGHLAEALCRASDAEVHGVNRHGSFPNELTHLQDRVAVHPCELADGAACEALLRQVQPERIFHLAGYANAGRSFVEPDAAWSGNLEVTRNLYTALARWGGKPRVLFVSSGLVYGESANGVMPLREEMPLYPNSPYAASKAAADLLSYQVARSTGLEIVRVRPFNHTGPRQLTAYAIPNFAKQIAQIERGEQPPTMQTGNLSALRDLSDVRDVVRGYILLMERGVSGEVYNIASGRATPIQHALEHLLSLARVHIDVREQEERSRAAESAVVCGDVSKLRSALGWRPEYTLERTLLDTLEYWRHQP